MIEFKFSKAASKTLYIIFQDSVKPSAWNKKLLIKNLNLLNSSEMKINKKTLCNLTIAMICSNLASFWKFQDFRSPIYNPVEYLWWSFYCKNSKPLSIFTKKLHHRCFTSFNSSNMLFYRLVTHNDILNYTLLFNISKIFFKCNTVKNI